MTTNRIINAFSALAVVLCAAVAPIAVSPAFAQYDLGGGYGGDTSSYDLGGGYGGSSYDLGGGFGGSSYDLGGGYGDSTSYDLGGGYGTGSSYDLGGGYSSSPSSYYDLGGGYTGSPSYDLGGGYGTTAGNEYAVGAPGSGTEYAVGSSCGASCGSGGTEYAVGAPCSSSCGGTEYAVGSPGGTEYALGNGAATSPSYTSSTPYYSNACGCYSSSPSYGYSTGGIPTYATQFIPGGVPPTPIFPTPIPSGPIFSAGQAPTSNTNTNTNVVPNTNTNTNTPVTYSTSSTGPISNTNTPTASVAPITNTNTASTAPINNTNTFAPVINIGATGQQRLAQYTLPTPSCSISAPYTYVYGQPITLTWTSSNATSAYISPSIGNVQPQGSTTVYPQGYTTYTMTVYGPGGTATCQATANYSYNYAPPTPTYYPPAPVPTPVPTTPSVSLTQIPYTGFDYGTLGDTMYWGVLLAFAVAAAYLLVYFRGGLSLASAFAFSRASDALEYSRAIEQEDETPAFAAPTIETAEEAAPVRYSALPTIERSRITTDSMIIDHSSDAPRIVIARN